MTAPDHTLQLDPDACRRARLARDARFDGEFFVAVSSTGIFCRPVCPARLPAERNVRYYRLAAQAAADGYRPCLRCRPETAPGSPAWIGSTGTVQRALRLIQEGALNDGGSVAALADRLGVGQRYLLKLFRRDVGVAPSELARHQRLLLARQLIVETTLPLTDVAFAAGFGSLRRFNSAIRESFGMAASEMRRRGSGAVSGNTITLLLRYRPPYDWDGVMHFLARHAVDGIESVDGGCYWRRLDDGGELRVRQVPGRSALQASFALPTLRPLQPLVSALRRMFDLDANPGAITAVLGSDPLLAPLLDAAPGVRCPGHFSAGEAALRAVVGQQISTVAARRICTSFAATCGGRFPSPAQLAGLPDSAFPMPGRRRDTLRRLAEHYRERQEEACRPDALAAMQGIGPWTTAMVALRGWGEPDAFPASDLGLVQAWERLGPGDESLASRSRRWSPYRGYAATLLWRNVP
jgi:AraC family transcriptional regulator of adaptative response / DNA-3-methyladenine glycosylase II